MTSPAFIPGTALVNPFNREIFIFTKPENPEVAEFEVRLGPGGSGGGNALLHVHHKDHLYLAGPPIWLQKMVFAVLSPLARMAGYRVPRS